MGKENIKMSSILLMGFILFGVVFIQVGYASLESSFYISGEANIKQPLRKLLYAPFDSIGLSDPPKMVLYLPMDGVGYPNENALELLDKEPWKDGVTGKNFTLVGDVFRSSTQVKIGNRSGYFSGTIAQSASISNPELNLGTHDFTISFWLNPTEENQNKIYSTIFANTNMEGLKFFIKHRESGIHMYYQIGTNYHTIFDPNKKYIVNEWTHYAIVRKDGVFVLYENGSKIAENSTLKNMDINLSGISLGGVSTFGNSYNGYIDDFAIYNYAKYDGDFPISIERQDDANLLYLDFDIPTNIEISKEPIKELVSGNYAVLGGNPMVNGQQDKFKFGNSSLYFSGVEPQSISISNRELNLGTHDFTISFWLNPSEENQNKIYSTVFANTNMEGLKFFIKHRESGIHMYYQIGTNYHTIFDPNRKYITNEWTHYAIVRKAGIFVLYENGSKIAENDTLKNMEVNLSGISLGGVSTFGNSYNGYIDDFAIYNYAKYDGNFNLPALDALRDEMNQTGTQLIVNDVATGKNFDISLYSNLMGDGTNKKFGTGSLYFPGIGPQSVSISNPELNLGTHDFTISFWLNPSEENQNKIYSTIFANTNMEGLKFFIKHRESGIHMYYQIGTNYHTIFDPNKKCIVNEWTHYTIVRKDGVFVLYENGSKIAENDTLKSMEVNLSGISLGGVSTFGNSYNGYMDDFVIYNKAIYEGEFNPPSSPAGDL